MKRIEGLAVIRVHSKGFFPPAPIFVVLCAIMRLLQLSSDHIDNFDSQAKNLTQQTEDNLLYPAKVLSELQPNDTPTLMAMISRILIPPILEFQKVLENNPDLASETLEEG